MYIKYLVTSLLLIAGTCYAHIESGKYHDYRNTATNEIQKMQDFHLKQARAKINEQDLAHAWGDLAYLLCQVPNHHLALQQMLQIAPQLHKEEQMHEYLDKAIKLYPNDDVVHMFFGAFLHNQGDMQNAKLHLDMAKKFGDLKLNDLTLNNSVTNQP